MPLEKFPFIKYDLKEKEYKDIFTVRLTLEERKTLDSCKKLLQQKKDSTALKMLAWIGAKVIHDDLTNYILLQVFKNKKNNERLGIIEFEDISTNVTQN